MKLELTVGRRYQLQVSLGPPEPSAWYRVWSAVDPLRPMLPFVLHHLFERWDRGEDSLLTVADFDAILEEIEALLRRQQSRPTAN